MATKTKGRVVLSTNARESLKLAENVYTKHQADGNASILLSLEDGLDWAVTGPKINTCLAKHEEAEQLAKDAEKAYRDRDAMLTEINGIVIASKNLLKGKYTNNPKALGDWGFVVDDTPKAKKNKE
ncbi:hypothetical protein [Ferruginibacter albus]|uniref:hypothetical protein n=1 Tax=Ferruginibacter albus TaxID=2875540 RepID=UPI001CC370A3|nr:hypothetical protein [Ferruginibacter albus]UAY52477.1 hypothetical protein K9M53_02015 [Ferruginibacter albus]